MARKARLEQSEEVKASLSEDAQAAFLGAMRDYLEAYGGGEHRLFTLDASNEYARTRNLADGGREETLAIGLPSRIVVIPRVVATWSGPRLRNIALHEMTHASKPHQPLSMDPVTLPDGAVAFATSGFSLKVRLPSSEETLFGLLEEGAAEALAYSLDPKYDVQAVNYHRVGSLTLKLMSQLGLRPDALALMLQRNDLWGFVNRIRLRAGANRAGRDLVTVVQAFNDAWNGVALTKVLASLQRR